MHIGNKWHVMWISWDVVLISLSLSLAFTNGWFCIFSLVCFFWDNQLYRHVKQIFFISGEAGVSLNESRQGWSFHFGLFLPLFKYSATFFSLCIQTLWSFSSIFQLYKNFLCGVRWWNLICYCFLSFNDTKGTR